MATEMFTKKKRVRAMFLFFLITFTHSSFPLSWETISKKTCSYFVKSFQLVEKFLNTKTGQAVGSVAILVLTIYIMNYFIKKNISGSNSEIKKLQKKKGKESLNFEKNYFGKIPKGVITLMKWTRGDILYEEFGNRQDERLADMWTTRNWKNISCGGFSR